MAGFSGAGIAVPAYIDTGRAGHFGRPPIPTGGSPSTSPDVTASQMMQQTMKRKLGEDIPEDSLDPLGEELVRDNIVIRSLAHDIVSGLDAQGDSFGLFIPVPLGIVRQIESQFPLIKAVCLKDDSPPHVTLLYLGNIDRTHVRSLKEIIAGVALQHRPFRMHLCGTDYFDNSNQTVLFVHALSPELDELHYDLHRAVGNAGHDMRHVDFDNYVGHMTLQYLPPETRIQHMSMEHSWIVDRFELWGAGSPVMFRLGEMTPIREVSLIDEDEETEDMTTTEISAAGGGAVSGYTLPLGKKSKYGTAPSWQAAADAFGHAKLAKKR